MLESAESGWSDRVDDERDPRDREHREGLRRATERARVERDRVVQRIEVTREQLEAARPGSPLVDAAFRAAERDATRGGVVLAGAIAFRLFLFVVPLVFVFVVGFGFAADSAGRDARDVAQDAGVGGLVAKAIGSAQDLSTFERVTACLAGAFAAIVGARTFGKVLRVAHAIVWDTPIRRPKGSLRSVAALVGATLVAFAGSRLLDKLGDASLVGALLATVLAAALPFYAWTEVSWHLPHRAGSKRDLYPGALVVALGVIGLHVVTVYWISRQLERRSDMYGAIGGALALLLWAYLLGRLIVASAVLNASLWQRRQEHSPEVDEAPEDRASDEMGETR